MRAGERLADLTRVERPAFHDELRLVEQASYGPPRLFAALQYGAGTGVALVGLLVLLAQLHPVLPLALVVVSVPHLLAERRLRGLVYQAMAQRSRAAREMDYCARVTTDPAAAKEVRVFGVGPFFRRRFRERFTAAFAEMHQLRLSHLRTSAAFGALHALALAGGFWYVASRVGAAELTLGAVALYLGAVAQAESRLLTLSSWWGIVYEIALHLRGLFGFVDGAGPGIALAPQGEGRPMPAALRQGIALRHVHFRYPEGAEDVLYDVSAHLKAGQVTALVGANGAGKSTLVKLLTRMYDPSTPPNPTRPPDPPDAAQPAAVPTSTQPSGVSTSTQPPNLPDCADPPGDILVDGVPLREYDLASVRRRVAVLYQDFARFALTLEENITVGAFAVQDADGTGGADGQDARVEMAARWAGADAVAARLPQGYGTELTRRFAGGVELSGGEWQKVALARAFVRNAALVIRDEPTAALDAEAEYRLFRRFRELVAGKTALLISHRFSTVRMADHILVLEGGRIVEAGTHGELLALGGRYAALYEMQAGRYREGGVH
jgi:ATP-binding cassette subfamily B protein